MFLIWANPYLFQIPVQMKIEKSVDVVLWIQPGVSCRIEGTDGLTELWWLSLLYYALKWLC